MFLSIPVNVTAVNRRGIPLTAFRLHHQINSRPPLNCNALNYNKNVSKVSLDFSWIPSSDPSWDIYFLTKKESSKSIHKR